MYKSADLRGVHLEMTTRCNARCPMCPRNLEGGKTVAHLPLAELSLDDVRTIFPESLVERLSWLYMCGNYGDAMTARDTLEAFAYFRATNPKMSLKLFTNGSGRTPEWWRALARVVTTCTFSIDGLEDTNHLYRRGTQWPIVMRSVDAFIGAGGRAEWDYLVFRHNESQIEEAHALSRVLGFARFNLKKTSRFLLNGKVVESRPVKGWDGAVEYELEMPVDPAHRNAALEDFDRASAEGEDHLAYLSGTAVSCKVEKERQVFVSGEGHVFPCCWTAKLHDKPGRAGEVWRLLEKLPGGVDALDARRRPLDEIVDGPFFQSLVPASWEPGGDARRDFSVCARSCGVRDHIRAQRQEPEPTAPAPQD